MSGRATKSLRRTITSSVTDVRWKESRFAPRPFLTTSYSIAHCAPSTPKWKVLSGLYAAILRLRGLRERHLNQLIKCEFEPRRTEFAMLRVYSVLEIPVCPVVVQMRGRTRCPRRTKLRPQNQYQMGYGMFLPAEGTVAAFDLRECGTSR